MKNVFQKTKLQKRERGERGEESKNNKERERSKRARQVLIHSLTPDHPPLAAITGIIFVNLKNFCTRYIISYYIQSYNETYIIL